MACTERKKTGRRKKLYTIHLTNWGVWKSAGTCKVFDGEVLSGNMLTIVA